MSNVATINPPRQSLVVTMATAANLEPAVFARTVRATCMPGNVSDEEFAAFLMVAHRYGLDPITKEIYAFPKKGGGIQPIVGIDGWMNLINSHPSCDGLEFKDEFGEDGKLSAITAIIHRKDRKHPTMVTEYMAECKRPTEPWQKWPARMLRHKAAIQCARYAFGFAGIIDPEEAERSPEVITGNVAPPPPPAPRIDTPVQPEPEVEDATDIEPFDAEAFLTELSENLATADTEEVVMEVWDQFDVEATLTNDEAALQRAFDIRKARIEAMEADGAFPGDLPAEERDDSHIY